MTTLADLGERVCVIGPSSSGKSTLAAAIGVARGLPVVHLDQLHHRPDSDWVPRPRAEFDALHAEAIAGGRWVIEGNYAWRFAERFARATGVILLDVAMPVSLARYLRRSWFEKRRVGGLASGLDSVKWDMIRHIVVVTPGNRRTYRARLEALTLPRIALPSRAAIADFYRREGLVRR